MSSPVRRPCKAHSADILLFPQTAFVEIEMDDIILLTLDYLDASSASRLRRTCTRLHALITDPILDRLFAKHLIHFHQRRALTELALLFLSFCTSTHTSLPETYAPRGIIRTLSDHEAKHYDSLVRILCNHLKESHAQNQIPDDVVSALLKGVLKRSTAFAHPDTIIYLLDDPRVDIHTDHETPFRNAVEGQNLPVVQLLLEKGANLRVYAYHNLSEAAKAGNIPLMQLLLDNGINRPHNTSHISSAVGEACAHGHEDMAMFLLTQVPVPQASPLERSSPQYYSYALEKAAQSGMQSVVDVLLSRQAYCKNSRALGYAAGHGMKKTVETMLDRGADVHSGGAFALMSAAEGGDVAVMGVLLSKGRANAYGHASYALMAAVEHGRVGMVKLLVESAFDVYGLSDERFEFVLGMATDGGQEEIREILLQWRSKRNWKKRVRSGLRDMLGWLSLS
ncbi:hypothetical protein HK104_008396 [Borealophlyctis nickersoniae]|nr:hypothetical protein HK104_008396 [Borealophlyctis nickersoniae]